jgi:hypothetical protein
MTILLARRKRLFVLAMASAMLSGVAIAPAAQTVAPAAIFVTWNGDPTTTVSVDWHLAAGADIAALEVRGPGLTGWKRFGGSSVRFPFSTRTVRRAHVTDLRPGSSYELRIGAGKTYRYRTMPARLTRPVRFAAGGDTQAELERFGPMNRVAAARDVDFVMFGGDLAYSNGDPRLVAREEAWYETVTNTLVTRDGRLIPVIAAIGNHEVFSNRDTTAEVVRVKEETGVKVGDSPYYTALHAHAGGRQYSVVDVGDYLSLVLLNTGHTASVDGAQSVWLGETLARRANVPHVFPIYHVPGYPSVRTFDGGTSKLVREHWVPLFERSSVRVAFENHDHAYKRTYPLRNGRRDSTGVVYIGDGSWGAGPREIGRDQPEPAWYVEKSASVNHGIIVTLDGDVQRYEMVDAVGTTFDTHVARRVRVPQSARVP